MFSVSLTVEELPHSHYYSGSDRGALYLSSKSYTCVLQQREVSLHCLLQNSSQPYPAHGTARFLLIRLARADRLLLRPRQACGRCIVLNFLS